MDEIEKLHPGYLRELFRHAQKVKGVKATFAELADAANQKSAAPGEERSTLLVGKTQMYKWFHANGGTEKSSLERPRIITDDLKGQRLSWVKLHWLLLTDPEAAVGMLDEKWFYTTNRR
jgi:hypothetical protein